MVLVAEKLGDSIDEELLNCPPGDTLGGRGIEVEHELRVKVLGEGGFYSHWAQNGRGAGHWVSPQTQKFRPR